jgi:hypothetical protein
MPPIPLVRLVHPGGRDHDIYRVGEGRAFLSRHAAIIEAHLQACRPMFQYEDGKIVRLPSEGALPLEWARTLRVLSNGGATESGWGYAVSQREAEWLGKAMPDLISGTVGGARPSNPPHSYRWGRGHRRPLWINGSIAA